VSEFLKEYSRIINHNNLPILSPKNNLDLYKHWLVNPLIIDDIIYFAVKSKYTIKSSKFWDVFISKSMKQNYFISELKSKYFLIASLIRNKIITNKNIDANIDAIFELFHLNVLSIDGNEKKKVVEAKLEKDFALLFKWSKTLSAFEGKIAEMIRFHSTKFEVIRKSIDPLIYNGIHFLDFISILNAKMNCNYILRYGIEDLSFFYNIYLNIPQAFKGDVLSASDNNQSDDFYETFFPQIQASSILIVKRHSYSSGQLKKSWLYHLLEGNTLRTANHLPVFLTKKAENLLRRNEDNLHRGSLSLEIIHYALRVEGVSALHTRIMSRIINDQEEKDFWFKTMVILFKNGIPTDQITNVKDYINHRVFEEGVNLKLKSKKMDNLLRDVEKWHIELYAKKNIRNARLPKSTVLGFSTEIKGVKYQISQIVTERNLFVEGERLNHCVYSYKGDCMNNYSEIFSLHTVNSDKTKEPLITIELNGNEIVQKRGKFNRAPNAIESTVIQRWAEEVNLNIREYDMDW
jgi:hypothetical protein